MVALKQMILANSLVVGMAINSVGGGTRSANNSSDSQRSSRNSSDGPVSELVQASAAEKLRILRTAMAIGDGEVKEGDNEAFGHATPAPVKLHVDFHQPRATHVLGIRICEENNIILGSYSNDRNNWELIKKALPGAFPTNWKIDQIGDVEMSNYDDVKDKLQELKKSQVKEVEITFKPAFKRDDLVELIAVKKVVGNKVVKDPYVFNVASSGLLDYDEPVHSAGQKFLVVNTPKGTSHPQYEAWSLELEQAADIGNILKKALTMELEDGEVGKQALEENDATTLAKEVLDDKVTKTMADALKKSLGEVKKIQKKMEICWKYELVHIQSKKTSFREASRFQYVESEHELAIEPQWFVPKHFTMFKYDFKSTHWKPDRKWTSFRTYLATFVSAANVTPLCKRDAEGKEFGKGYYDSKANMFKEIDGDENVPESVVVPSATEEIPREKAYGWAVV